MRHGTDGQEELVRRLLPEDVLPWFEGRRHADDADAGVFASWLASQSQAGADDVLRDLHDRVSVLNALGNRVERQANISTGACRKSILGSGMLRTLLRNGDLAIEPLDVRLVHVDSVDLRVGTAAWKQIDSHAPIRAATLTPADFSRLHRQICVSEAEPIVLAPGAFVDVLTLENVRLPRDYAARVENVSGRARLGLLVALAQHVHAGHAGPIVLEFKNQGEFTLKFAPGDVVAQLVLERVDGGAEAYGENTVPYGNNNANDGNSNGSIDTVNGRCRRTA